MEILIGIAVLAVAVYVYTRFVAKQENKDVVDAVKPVVPPTRPVDSAPVQVKSVEVAKATPVAKDVKPAVKKEKAAKKPAKAPTKAPAKATKTAKPKKPKMTVVK